MNHSPRERARTSSGVPRGFFVTLEGIEGSGKSTHARRLEQVVRDLGFLPYLTREPGGTPLGDALRGLALGGQGEPPVAEAELFIILAARAQHVQEVILPRLARGEVVISDRYADASLAYQGGGRGLGIDRVRAVGELATSGLLPDLTLLCDLPVDEALERVHSRRDRGGDFNRFDQENREFYEAVRAAYLELARREPDRFQIVQSTAPKDDIAERFQNILTPRLRERAEEGGLSRS
jgi:dTMP kinase